MANLTRDTMVTELQSRGWSRFQASDLQRYLDWALRDVYTEGRFEDSLRDKVELSNSAMTITLASIDAAATHSVASVEGVDIQRVESEVRSLEYALDDYFMGIMLPEAQLDTPTKGTPSFYYVYGRTVYLYPAPDQAYTTIFYYVSKKSSFASGSDTTGLPEQFDRIVIARAEVHCFRRAHDYEGMNVAAGIARDMMLSELNVEADVAHEGEYRIERYGH